MPPPGTSNAPPPMRQSCDRCHRQKLRCTRTSNAGVCNRCLRKRVECVYSSCLPKGRPSLYKATDEAAAEPETGLITPKPEAHSGAGRSPRVAPGGSDFANDDATAPSADGSLTPGMDTGLDLDMETMDSSFNGAGIFVTSNMRPHHDHNHNISGGMNKGLVPELVNISPDVCTADTWPSLQAFMGFDGPLDWENGSSTPDWQGILDSQVDYDETPLFNGFPSVEGEIGGGLISPEHLIISNTQPPCAGPAAVEGFPGFDGTYKYDHSIDIIIMRLFQLSMSLGQLRRSSYALAQSIQSSSSSSASSSSSSASSSSSSSSSSSPSRDKGTGLLDDAAFKSVAAWVHEAGGPPRPEEEEDQSPGTTESRGGLLHDVLSASHHLLEILMDGSSTLQVHQSTFAPTPTPAPTPTLSAFSSSSSLATQVSNASDGGSSIYTFSSSQRSNNNIIRHLVIACHTMLLTIHVAILAALQHDAEQPVSPLGTTALGQIRLVSVVQLCAYVIERQHQAVDSYLGIMQQTPLRRASPSWSSHLPLQKNEGSANHDTAGLHPLPSPVLVPEDEAMRDLTNEVHQRLLRLQQTLRIC